MIVRVTKLLGLLCTVAVVVYIPDSSFACHTRTHECHSIGAIYAFSTGSGEDIKHALELARDVANGDVDISLPFYQRLKGLRGLKGDGIKFVLADHQSKPDVGAAES